MEYFTKTHDIADSPRDSGKNDSSSNKRLEELEDRIIFKSGFNEIDWTEQGNYKMFFGL